MKEAKKRFTHLVLVSTYEKGVLKKIDRLYTYGIAEGLEKVEKDIPERHKSGIYKVLKSEEKPLKVVVESGNNKTFYEVVNRL